MMSDAASSVFLNPELFTIILKELPTQEIGRCACVNRQFNSCAIPLLTQAWFNTYSSPFLRSLSKAPVAILQNNTFLFTRLLEGTPKNKEDLKELLKPLEIGPPSRTQILTKEEVNSIVASVVKDAGQKQTPQTPQTRFQTLLESGLLKKNQIETLKELNDGGQLSKVKIDHLYSKGGVLLMACGKKIDFDAFSCIPDDDIKTGIFMTLVKQYTTDQPDEAERLSEVEKNMVTSGLFVNFISLVRNTPLSMAIRWIRYPFAVKYQAQAPLRIREEILQKLVSYGADVNGVDLYGSPSMHYVAPYTDCQNILKMLIDNGARLNARDNQGRTPMHLAAFHNNIQNLEILLEKGGSAFMHLKDQEGRTLWSYANENEEMQNLLRQYTTTLRNQPEVTDIA